MKFSLTTRHEGIGSKDTNKQCQTSLNPPMEQKTKGINYLLSGYQFSRWRPCINYHHYSGAIWRIGNHSIHHQLLDQRLCIWKSTYINNKMLSDRQFHPDIVKIISEQHSTISTGPDSRRCNKLVYRVAGRTASDKRLQRAGKVCFTVKNA